MRSSLSAFPVLLACLLLAARAGGQERGGIESLVMPGPVARAHAQTEGKCGACHARLDATTQTRLCADCHKDVAADISGRTGYHGRIPNAERAQCRTCHTEHKGRDADIVRLDRETFDHAATDYQLHGAHATVACDGCHRSDSKFRDASSVCYDCHRKDDIHSGKLGESCSDCHSESEWRTVRYDHDKTHFPLHGAHASVSCSGCHVNQRYTQLPTDCYSCHRINDKHDGTRGRQCAKCHTETEWRDAKFDHDRDTRFPLAGAHGSVACSMCHKQDPYVAKVATDCAGCHRKDDSHVGRNGDRCENCHTAAAWKEIRFDHAAATRFPLHNRHAEISCVACHRGQVYEDKLSTDCYSCHRTDDVHAGQLGKQCGSCHGDASWTRDLAFDHDLARFPLLGLHVAVPCEQCHLTAQFRNVSTVCVDCHKSDDAHRATLGPRCEQCHSPAGWRLWSFDHDTRTSFPLLGAHRPLACAACHRQPTTGAVELAKTCDSCHHAEDAHGGRFGTQCEQCHTETSFADVRVRRER
jgi:hypothetical protein